MTETDARTRIRWYELLPEAVLAIGLLAFAITEPRAAAGAFKSGRAVFLMVLVAIAWLGLRLLTFRRNRWPIVTTVLFGVAALAILKVVVLPAYQDHTVVEAAPVRTSIRAATFHGIDHRASGDVRVYRSADGPFVVGLERFEIQPGPDYDVYVVPGANRRTRDHATRLDDLRGDRGTQFYDVPAGVDLGSGDWTVLVWCQTFGVPVANATPS